MTDIEQKQIFMKNLNKYLNERQKTQREVAEAIDVSPQTFNTWCQGIALPRMGKVQRLADYFNIGKTDLLDDKSNLTDTKDDILKKIDLDVMRKLSDINIVKVNKYASNLLSVQQMEDEPVLMAAHNDNPTADELDKIKEDMELLKRPK